MSARTKGKTSEREMAVLLQTAAGKVTDPKLRPLVTVTGRVGHITELGFDILVGEGPVALCGEAKRRKNFLSADALRALLQIDRISREWERQPVLGFRLADDVPTYHEPTQKGAHKTRVRREWGVTPLPYLAELLAARRYIEEIGDGARFLDWWAQGMDEAETNRRRLPVEEVAE